MGITIKQHHYVLPPLKGSPDHKAFSHILAINTINPHFMNGEMAQRS